MPELGRRARSRRFLIADLRHVGGEFVSSVAVAVRRRGRWIASSIVAADPRCRYGAVAQASRSVGMSIPVSGPPRRLPLSAVMVPMFCGLLLALLVNAVPPWQPAQFLDWKSGRPLTAAAVRLPSGLRNGLEGKV